jgi:hypothetical protein
VATPGCFGKNIKHLPVVLVERPSSSCLAACLATSLAFAAV